MLTRIEIDGFKTFDNFVLDLSPFLVIVGPNATGKSNLFDAIQLLSRLAYEDLRTAFNSVRGEPHELFRILPDGRPGNRMRLCVEVLLNRSVQDPWGVSFKVRHTRIRYEVAIERIVDTRGFEKLVVTRESAEPIRGNDDSWKPQGKRPSNAFRKVYMSYQRPSAFLSTTEEGGVAIFHLHQDPTGGRTRAAPIAETTILSGVTTADFPHLFALREELRSWKFLQLDPGALRKPSPKNSPDLLEPDGSNLATVLARIEAETASTQQPHGRLAEISADLSRLISGVTNVNVIDDELNRKFRIEIQTGGDHPFSSQVVSDGTLRVLALLTMLHDPRHSGLLCFEEPENGIHPARLGALLEILRRLVTNTERAEYVADQPLTQMLLNSHSPVVLSHLDNHEMVFADTVTSLDPRTRTKAKKTRMRRILPEEQGQLQLPSSRAYDSVDRFMVNEYLRTVRTG